MANHVVRTINLGFAGFFASMLLCIAIRPQGLFDNNGFSYYGVFASTIVPYALAFAVCGLFLARAARELPAIQHSRVFIWLFRISALLLLGLVLTPHNVPLIENIHIAFGITLFSLEFLVAIWMTVAAPTVVKSVLMAVMLVSGLASLYYLPLQQGYLLETQALFELGFWLLLVQTIGDGLNELGENGSIAKPG